MGTARASQAPAAPRPDQAVATASPSSSSGAGVARKATATGQAVSAPAPARASTSALDEALDLGALALPDVGQALDVGGEAQAEAQGLAGGRGVEAL